MRSRMLRLSRLVKSTLEQQGGSPFAVASTIGAGLGLGAYIYGLIKKDQEINAYLPTYVEMRDYRSQLTDAFHHRCQGDEAASHTFNALLEAIEIDDVKVAALMLNDLMVSDMITDDIRDGIIVLAANHSKINILELLQDKFGSEHVLRNRHARDLLSLNAEEKNAVSETLEQFYQSPGKITPEGMRVFIKVKQQDLLDENMRHLQLPAIPDSSDLAENIAHTFMRLVSARKMMEELEEKFRRTIVVDLTQYPEFETYVENFYRQLLAEAQQQQKSVVGTMVMTGGHFTLAQIKVVPQTDNNHAVIVYIDSLGSFLSVTTSNYHWVSSLPHHVFDDVTLMVSEDKNQYAIRGCSLFVCDQYGTIMNLDKIMARNTQYSFAGNQDVLFDYAQHARTIRSKYGVDYSHERGSYAGVNNFDLFLLPACLIVGRQSLDSREVRHDTIDMFLSLPDGRYTYVYDNKHVDQRTSVLGLMGINRARQASSPERQIEFNRPADLSGSKTVDEVIAENLDPANPQGAEKQRNRRIERLGYQLGLFLAQNPRDVIEARKIEAASISVLNQASIRNKQ